MVKKMIELRMVPEIHHYACCSVLQMEWIWF